MLLFLSLFYLNFNAFLSHVFYLLLLTSYSFRLPLVTSYKLNYFWSSFRLPLVTSYKLNYCLSSFRLPQVTSYKLNYCWYSFRLPLVTSYKLNYCWYSFRLPLATSYKLNFEDKILKRHGTGEIQFALRPEFRPFPFYYSIPYQYSRLKSCCFSLDTVPLKVFLKGNFNKIAFFPFRESIVPMGKEIFNKVLKSQIKSEAL